jgi:hypothetical protein
MKRVAFLIALALRRAGSTPGRSALVSLGVGLGVALMVAIRILNSSAAASFKSDIEGLSPRVHS